MASQDQGSGASQGRPKLVLKPRDPAAARAAESTRAASGKANPFGAAKPREAVLATRVGKSESDILKEEVAKEKLHLRLTKEQSEEKEAAEEAVREIQEELKSEDAPSKVDALQAELGLRQEKLDKLVEGFEKLAVEQAKAGGGPRPSERRAALDQRQGYGPRDEFGAGGGVDAVQGDFAGRGGGRGFGGRGQQGGRGFPNRGYEYGSGFAEGGSQPQGFDRGGYKQAGVEGGAAPGGGFGGAGGSFGSGGGRGQYRSGGYADSYGYGGPGGQGGGRGGFGGRGGGRSGPDYDASYGAGESFESAGFGGADVDYKSPYAGQDRF